MPLLRAVATAAALLLLQTLTTATSQATSNADAAAAAPIDRRLLFTALLIRHGDRSPLSSFPTDTLPLSAWPEGVGELTAVGTRAQYEHGARLRARYVQSGFLPETYSQPTMHVRSTDVDRTLMSANALLTGLYPPGSASLADVRERFGGDALSDAEGGLPHRIQAIPVHTVSRPTEDMLVPGANCPRHDRLMAAKRASADFRAMSAENAHVLAAAQRVSGRSGEFTLFDLSELSDTFTVYAAHGVPLHTGATPALVSQARNLSDWMLTFGNEGLEVNRLRSGLLLNELKERMALANLADRNAVPAEFMSRFKKFVLYSAHDTTLAATLSALRVFDGHNPPYNSTVTWELHSDRDRQLTVHVEYNGQPLLLPGCSDEFCPMVEYLASTKDRTMPGPIARKRECMTGFQRFAAMGYAFLSNEKNEDEGNFGLAPDDKGSLPLLGSILVVVASVGVAVGVAVAAIRIRSKYHGYSVTASNEKGFSSMSGYGAGAMDSLSDRPILM